MFNNHQSKIFKVLNSFSQGRHHWSLQPKFHLFDHRYNNRWWYFSPWFPICQWYSLLDFNISMDFSLNFVKIDYMKMWCNVFCNLSWSTFKLLEHLLNMIHFLLATWCMKWEGLAATWSSTWGSLHIFQFLKKAYLLLTTLLHVKHRLRKINANYFLEQVTVSQENLITDKDTFWLAAITKGSV